MYNICTTHTYTSFILFLFLAIKKDFITYNTHHAKNKIEIVVGCRYCPLRNIIIYDTRTYVVRNGSPEFSVICVESGHPRPGALGPRRSHDRIDNKLYLYVVNGESDGE